MGGVYIVGAVFPYYVLCSCSTVDVDVYAGIPKFFVSLSLSYTCAHILHTRACFA